MYIKDTPQFNLLKRLYDIDLATIENSTTKTLGIAWNKVENDFTIVEILTTDGYITQTQRKKGIDGASKDFTAIWITPKGRADFKSYLDAIPSKPLPQPDPQRVRLAELKVKGWDNLTTTEKAEGTKLIFSLFGGLY